MRQMWAAGIVAAACVGLSATEWTPEPRSVLEAVALGQTSVEADRAQFHQPYHVAVARPPLDAVDIVTPFRRVVIAAELQARAGNRRFGQRDALAVLARFPQRVSIHLELTFHPQNTFVLVPQYAVGWLTRRGVRLEPATVEATPRYYPRTGAGALPVPSEQAGSATPPTLPGRSRPMLGATIVATFRGEDLERREDPVQEIVIGETGRDELARLPIDLAKLR